MRVSAKGDYALRAVAELAAAWEAAPVKGERIAQRQAIPLKFLENILMELKRARIVRSHRGPDGGYTLARDPSTIMLADVLRAVEGPLTTIRGERPEEIGYEGPAADLTLIWIALRATLRAVLERVSVAELASRTLPEEILQLTRDPDLWTTRDTRPVMPPRGGDPPGGGGGREVERGSVAAADDPAPATRS
jgi:Rrf2 family protein